MHVPCERNGWGTGRVLQTLLLRRHRHGAGSRVFDAALARLRHQPKEETDMKSMDDLFYAILQDVYYAEKQLVKVLPKLAKKSTDPQLQKAFTDHLEETEGHVERLDQVFDMIDKKARGKKCDAILGIVAEGDEVIKEADDEEIRDAGILAAAQAAEHYEIARYGTLCAWANQLGKPQIARILHQTLEEEKKADALLSGIAERSVNKKALSA
jgi:ferritin-like metal-binding protein YciE